MKFIIFTVLLFSSQTLFAQDIDKVLNDCISKSLKTTLERSDCEIKHELNGEIRDITQSCKMEALDKSEDVLSGAKALKNFDSDALVEQQLNHVCGHKGKISYLIESKEQ